MTLCSASATTTLWARCGRTGWFPRLPQQPGERGQRVALQTLLRPSTAAPHWRRSGLFSLTRSTTATAPPTPRRISAFERKIREEVLPQRRLPHARLPRPRPALLHRGRSRDHAQSRVADTDGKPVLGLGGRAASFSGDLLRLWHRASTQASCLKRTSTVGGMLLDQRAHATDRRYYAMGKMPASCPRPGAPNARRFAAGAINGQASEDIERLCKHGGCGELMQYFHGSHAPVKGWSVEAQEDVRRLHRHPQ